MQWFEHIAIRQMGLDSSRIQLKILRLKKYKSHTCNCTLSFKPWL